MSKDSVEQLDELASQWLVKRDSQGWTEADQRELDAWLNESPLHRVAYLRIEHVWECAERLRVLGAGARPGEVPSPGQWNFSPFARMRSERGHAARSVRLRAIAASVAALMALGTGWYLSQRGSEYRTPIGGLTVVPMADGSTLTLNTDSRVRVAMSDQERRVALEQGEAYFEVAKDPHRPFIVDAGDKRVIAVGTRFSVRRDADDIRIVVTEGKVRVEPARGASPALPAPLVAGTIALANDTGVLVRQQTLPEVQEELSWRTGVLVFRDATLGEAAAEFNRYNARKIVIRDHAIAMLRVAGSFRATNSDAFVELLEHGYPLRADYSEDSIVLRGTQSSL